MCLLRNNSASAYGARVYLEMFHACWKAWFSHSMLLCSFTCNYKTRWLQQFALQRILSTAPFLIQRCFGSPLTQAWPEFNKRVEENKTTRAGWSLSLSIKHCEMKETAIRTSVLVFGTDARYTRMWLFFRPLSSQTLWCVWKNACHSVFPTNSSPWSEPHNSVR